MNATSPCIRVCRLDDTGRCTGCYRTLAEISRWLLISEQERVEIMAVLAGRREVCAAETKKRE